jgi:dephospho-CoA kinase
MSSESNKRSIYTVALTGGIASGKSAVANRFAALDVPLIDADVIAHVLVQPGQPALAEIAATFGPSVITASGALDRKKMRELVFDDRAARKKLEAILHPRIHSEILDKTAHCLAPYCVVAIPLFVETHHDYAWVDRVLVTDVPEAVQIARLTSRPGIDDALARGILAAQAPRDRRLAIADDIIDNTAPIAYLEGVSARLHERYLRLAEVRRSRTR